MTIKSPHRYPATETMLKERIFIMSETGVITRDIGSLASLSIKDRTIALPVADMAADDAGAAENRHRGVTLCDGVRMALTVTQPAKDAFTTMLRLTNESTENSPRIRGVRSFDVRFPAIEARFDGIMGDNLSRDSFAPYTRALAAEPYVLEPVEGRSSSATAFPCFDVTVTTPEGTSLTYVFGVGWSGQWHAEMSCDGEAFAISVGLADSDFYLLPGESVRLPRVLCVRGEDPLSARQAFRRVVREHFSPKTEDGRELLLPMAYLSSRDAYNDAPKTRPEYCTEAGLLAELTALERLPSLDTFWFDAGWFPGHFPKGVGNYAIIEDFPHGLRPVADRAHEMGKKFVLWFEPERVVAGTEMAVAHPAYLLPADGQGTVWDDQYLYNLADDEACAYLTKLLGDMLEREGVDIFRIDCNINLIRYWRDKDGPDRRGITEMHYIENLYRMWDDLRARIPGLLIDNCASGGRRMDIEALSRAVTLWRSDTGCFPESEEFVSSIWNNQQTIALSRYLPYSCGGHWKQVPYDVRAAGTTGTVCLYDALDPAFDFARAEAILAECARVRPLWGGDFHPFTEADVRDDNWAAYALCRDGRGAVYAFRKKNAEEATMTVTLPGVEPTADYRVTLTDERMQVTTEILHGEALLHYPLRIDGKRESLLLEYEPLA